MSRQRYRWWPYVRAVIRDYPRMIPERDRREMRAVERMLESCTDERRRFIEVYYWRGNRIETAAYLSHIGEATARRWNGEIVRSVARELKLLRKNDTVRPSK